MKDFVASLFVLAILWTAQPSFKFQTAAQVWPSQTYVTENFTAPDLAVTRYGDTAPGYLFLTPSGNGTTSQAPVLISDSNELIWSGPSDGWVYNGFRVQHIHNKPYLIYWKGNSSFIFGHGYGSVYVLNSKYQEVYNVRPSQAELGLVTPSNIIYDSYLDEHESSITYRGTLIGTAYNVTPIDLTSVGGPKNGWIFDSLFFEFDLATGKVLFRWRSLDHLDKIPITDSHYPFVIPGFDFLYGTHALPWDYFHINSVQALPDGYLVNSRHLYTTYKVSNDGSIDWTLNGATGGDFTLQPPVYFSWQHNALLQHYSTNSSRLTITYFNDDNSEAQRGNNASSGLELSLDLKSRSVKLLRKLIVPSQPLFAAGQGSYQPLPYKDHVLVGYGQVATTREFDGAGNLVYEVQYGYSTPQSSVASYRSYRLPWTGEPSTPPKIAAKRTGSTTKVYLSWNGATTYDAWTIYAGDSADDLSPVASFPKSGFETEHELASNYTYISAEAKKGHRSLRKTSVLSVSS